MLLLDASGNVLRSGAPVRSRDETTSELTGGREYLSPRLEDTLSHKRILNSPNRWSFNPRPIFIHRCGRSCQYYRKLCRDFKIQWRRPVEAAWQG